MEIEQEEKAARLQQAVINSSIEELSEVYEELGYVEMSAPALGLACRFRGLAMVKTLIQKGASFDFPSTKEIEEKYDCYIGQKYGNYRTNYSMYLLKAFGEDLKIFCLKGMTMEKKAKREDGESLSFLPDEERVAVLKYLLDNKERIAFHPEELLYYAIYFRDTALVKELKKQDVKISDIRVNIITEGAIAMNGYWFEYVLLTERLSDANYLEVMQQLALEFGGKMFHYTGNILEITRDRFRDIKIFEFFLANFKQEKMNKTDIIRGLIDDNILDALPIVEREGWLSVSRKREEMIAYASKNGKTEILAWLLDFKNRTADFADEQEKAEKKLMRELNMAPDSAAALKKIWSYRKQEDDTLVITNYKGMDLEVTVPERIGKGIVTVVGDGAFAAGGGFNPRVTYEQMMQHKKIVKIILPKTLRQVGRGTFNRLNILEEIDLPKGVEEIGAFAFCDCGSLKSITIPNGVRRIGEYAFNDCTSLENIVIPGTVEHIGKNAFDGCWKLEEVHICEGVKEIDSDAFKSCGSLKSITIPGTIEKIGEYAFANCSKLEQVYICEGVKEIGMCAFRDCISLKSITIPETVEQIEKCAFADCSKLEQVCICGDVKKVGMIAFMGCGNLKEIRVLKSIQNRILGETFEHNPKLVVCCSKGSKTESYCKKKGIPFRNSDE